MPKSNPTLSPKTHHKLGSDDSTSRMTDIAVRKKKNADAQAAFRARRANYIATLEETVTSLESVVLQLQDSCREARNETQELKHENSRIRHEFREREKLWRTLWQTKKSQGLDDDLPPLPAFFTSAHGHNGHLGSLSVQNYGSPPYRMTDVSSVCGPPYNQSHYHSQSPSMAYAGVEADVSGEPQSLNHRGGKYSSYPYSIHGVPRETPWPSALGTSGSSGDSGAPASNHSSHSPGFTGSPTLASSEMPYISRFPMEDQKASLSTLDTAPYVFPTSRSLSPTTSTPNSSSSSSLTSFQFTFPESSGCDRPEFDYQRQSHSRGAEVTLHGGTADISLMGPASDVVRYRLGTRRVESCERPVLPGLPPHSGSDNGSQHERGSSDGDSAPFSYPRARRSVAPAVILSRSPSPGPPTLSGTLAVIKAQAFGALRRTRARTKKTEGAAMVAKDVLEARGIGMEASTRSKRQRVQDDDDDDDDNDTPPS